MIKKFMVAFIVTIGLVLGGCGDDTGERRLETQGMLDDGNYDGVISSLEGTATTSNDYIKLGLAYMGKAGFGIPDVIDMILEDDESDGDAFSEFVKDTQAKKTPTSISNLRKSTKNYRKALGNTECNATNLSDSSKNVCLYLGLGETVKSATAITYLVDDIEALTEDSIEDPKLKASACAMMYAFDKNQMDSECTAKEDGNITFANERTYKKLTITADSEDFDFLITDLNQTAITDGYCTVTDFSTRVNAKASELYYVCPLNESKDADDEITTVNVLLDALNNGTDAITASATEDMKKDIDEFKCDLFLGTYNEYSETCSNDVGPIDLSQELDLADIVGYLGTKD